jgi:hypothetical protein
MVLLLRPWRELHIDESLDESLALKWPVSPLCRQIRRVPYNIKRGGCQSRIGALHNFGVQNFSLLVATRLYSLVK